MPLVIKSIKGSWDLTLFEEFRKALVTLIFNFFSGEEVDKYLISKIVKCIASIVNK